MRRRYLRNRSDRISYPGLIAAWSAKGKTNEDADRNVLKDLTGNGHDITLKNFAYSGMSGYGGYETKAASWHSDMDVEFKKEGFKWEFSSIKNLNTALMYCDFDYNGTSKIRVQNIPQNIIVKCGDNRTNTSIKDITKDGIYEIDWSLLKSNTLPVIYTDKLFNNSNLIIEILPEYPDALVFDGVDDYGVNKSIKDVLNGCEEYTVIAKRKYIDLTKNHMPVFSITNIDSTINTLFLFEFYDGAYKTFNKASLTNNLNFPDVISWQTSNSYNQQLIENGFNTTVNGFVIGRYGRATQYVAVALYSYYIFNRTLPDQEIKSFIRKHIDPEYLLPSEIVPTPPTR